MVMEVFERISGARMHTAIYRPFDVGQDFVFNQLSRDVAWLVSKSLRLVSGAFLGLLNNRAFRSRCAGIGIFSAAKLRAYGVQGVIARASGLLVDSRLGLGYRSYGLYRSASAITYLGARGDCYDRFIVRCRELLESFRLVSQFLNALERFSPALKNAVRPRSKFVSMESTIRHFKGVTYTPAAGAGLGWSLVEGPKGGVSVLIVHSGAASPHRLHVRSPVAHNLHLLSTSTNGYTLADFVSTFCSMDVVLGEIDR
jgi:NADH:ubiquinone oxidoreductase subunit D